MQELYKNNGLQLQCSFKEKNILEEIFRASAQLDRKHKKLMHCKFCFKYLFLLKVEVRFFFIMLCVFGSSYSEKSNASS